jgi:superfamily II DNA/RNA helicase
MAGAQTGTGKTAAFVLPILQRLTVRANKSTSPAKHPVRCLILTPTRELAAQVSKELKKFIGKSKINTALLIGGESMPNQMKQLRMQN